MADTEIIVAQSDGEIVRKLTNFLQEISDDAITKRGEFFIGISGGSMINALQESLKNVTTTYDKWRIFFNDERVVAEDSEDSTYGACKKHLIGVINGLAEKHFIPMKQGLTVEEAASDYELKLRSYFPHEKWPRFDVLLLGLGEDGHTCSLFPGQPLLTEDTIWVGVVKNSPKKPPQRITFTYPILNNAANVIFVAKGEGKADALKGILVDKDEKLPAFKVKPKNGKLFWLLDQPSVKLVPSEFLK